MQCLYLSALQPLPWSRTSVPGCRCAGWRAWRSGCWGGSSACFCRSSCTFNTSLHSHVHLIHWGIRAPDVWGGGEGGGGSPRSARFEIPTPFFFFFCCCGCCALARERISTKMNTIENRFVILWPENILFAGLCEHFSSRKFDWLGQWRGLIKYPLCSFVNNHVSLYYLLLFDWSCSHLACSKKVTILTHSHSRRTCRCWFQRCPCIFPVRPRCRSHGRSGSRWSSLDPVCM